MDISRNYLAAISLWSSTLEHFSPQTVCSVCVLNGFCLLCDSCFSITGIESVCFPTNVAFTPFSDSPPSHSAGHDLRPLCGC